MLVGFAQAADDQSVRADVLHTLYHLCGSPEIRQSLRQVGASTAIKFVSHEVTTDQALLLLHRLVDDGMHVKHIPLGSGLMPKVNFRKPWN